VVLVRSGKEFFSWRRRVAGTGIEVPLRSRVQVHVETADRRNVIHEFGVVLPFVPSAENVPEPVGVKLFLNEPSITYERDTPCK
jgi:hypothetical protein